MIYTERELKEWWTRKAKSAQRDILDRMLEVTGSEFANSLMDRWLDSEPFSEKQLAAIRKWDR